MNNPASDSPGRGGATATGAPPTLVDTHTHIQGEEFAEDVTAVIERAREAGVTQMVVPGVDVQSSRAALALAEAHEGVFFTAGFHPHEASHLDAKALGEIEGMLAHPRAVAVGEVGLDYYYEHSPRDAQLACLEQMLDVAGRHRLPVVVHCRDAWDDAAALLAPWARRVRDALGARPVGVMHYFTGTAEQARFFIDLGFAISVHTSVTHRKQASLREVVAGLPLDALVVETDAPYGSPEPHRGKRNEPAFAVEAARQIAALHGVSRGAVAAATTANAARLFGLPVSAAGEGSRL